MSSVFHHQQRGSGHDVSDARPANRGSDLDSLNDIVGVFVPNGASIWMLSQVFPEMVCRASEMVPPIRILRARAKHQSIGSCLSTVFCNYFLSDHATGTVKA
jgi:hypothetical protein